MSPRIEPQEAAGETEEGRGGAEPEYTCTRTRTEAHTHAHEHTNAHRHPGTEAGHEGAYKGTPRK